MNTDYEIFRKIDYLPFFNNDRLFFLSTYPYLDIVMNDGCNAKCKFCISHLVHKKEKASIDLHKPKIEYAISHMGVKEVLLLGGEPTINDDMFAYIDYLKQFNLNKICTTTNGHRMSRDMAYTDKLFSSGLTHINISLMSLDESQQRNIHRTNTFVSLKDIIRFKEIADYHGVKIRINNNVFMGNNDTLDDMLSFYYKLYKYCHSLKFSPLLKTDSFSTVNEVTEFNRTHILSDDDYDNLWHQLEDHFNDYPIVRNKETFGFVEYSQIILPTPIILNYNQHGKLREKVIKESKINNIKLLPTGDLSLSWNREEVGFFIDTTVRQITNAVYPSDF